MQINLVGCENNIDMVSALLVTADAISESVVIMKQSLRGYQLVLQSIVRLYPVRSGENMQMN